MKDGKFRLDRSEIDRLNLYHKTGIYMRVYVYLFDKAYFKSNRRYKRGVVYLDGGIDQIVHDLKIRKSKYGQLVNSEVVYEVLRYLEKFQAISRRISGGRLEIIITGYDDLQTVKRKI